MRPFEYERATDVTHALTLLAERPNARFLGGGTNLVDLVRRGVETPDSLVDVTGLPLSEIEETPSGDLRVGAVVTNADLAHHPLVRTRYPLLSQAVLAGASGQLRTMATVGGNLLQRTRCAYSPTSQPAATSGNRAPAAPHVTGSLGMRRCGGHRPGSAASVAAWSCRRREIR